MSFFEKVLPKFMRPKENGSSPLVEAVKSVDAVATRKLLASGANPTEAGPDGITPLLAGLAGLRKAESALSLADVDVKPGMSALNVDDMVSAQSKKFLDQMNPTTWESFSGYDDELQAAHKECKAASAVLSIINDAVSPAQKDAPVIAGRLQSRRSEAAEPQHAPATPSLKT